MVDEEAGGQRILITDSANACDWNDPTCVAGDRESFLAHKCIALHTTEEAMYLVGMSEQCHIDASVVGMRRIDP